jgi:hypothetical protein
MPLLDHFHPPLEGELPWASLHSGWATRLADLLNEEWLPAGFRAIEHAHAGPRSEIDITTFEGPSATCTVPAVFPDSFEVRVFAGRGGWGPVGAVELISPGNKDRLEERRAFVAKCASYLQSGVSVVLIDIVTNRHANLHNELARTLNVPSALLPDEAFLYAAAYRPVLRQEKPELDVWTEAVAVGAPLPTMPLRITGDLFVPIEFEPTYTETCRRRGLP